MRMSYNDKIKKINDDRSIMLHKVKDKINGDNKGVSNNYEDVFSILDNDSKNSQEYKSIMKAKELIAKLVDEVCNASSVEEVIALRKKINYYINKIKKELVKRNITEEEYEKVSDKVNSLRRNVAMLIRVMKRDDTLKEIDSLYEKYDNLSDEDIINFKKLLSKEMSYNSRTLRNMDNNIVGTKVRKKKVEILNIVDDVQQINNIDESTVINVSPCHNEVSDSNIHNSLIDERVICVKNEENIYNTNNSNKNSLLDRVNYYVSHYQGNPLLVYNGSLVKNITLLLRNIPRYNKNKKLIKYAEMDYNTFYHGKDLEAFIAYSKRRNSIGLALDIIFKKGHLNEREIECLYQHERCVEWIDEFFVGEDIEYNNNSLLVKTKQLS
jgi:hypothetical protein